jgi:ParB-like chromosome segregation protein Spo0J
VHLDPERVRRYAELLGDDLPPVVAFGTDQGLLLVDGCNRVAVAQARGLDTIAAEIRPGTAHDALRLR